MVSDTVGMGEGLGAGSDGTGRRVSGIMVVQMRSHIADILQRHAAEGTPVAVLSMVLLQQLLLLEVRLAALLLILAGDRRDRRAGRRGGRLSN